MSLVNGLINGAELNSQNVALVFVMLWLLAKYSIYRALKKINNRLCQAVSVYSFLIHPMPLYHVGSFTAATAALAVINSHIGFDAP